MEGLKLTIVIFLCTCSCIVRAQISDVAIFLSLGNQDYIDFTDSVGQYHRINISKDTFSIPIIKTDSNFSNKIALASLQISLLENNDVIEVSSLGITYMFVDDILSGQSNVIYDSSFISTPYSDCDIILSHNLFVTIQEQIKTLFSTYKFSKDNSNFIIPKDMIYEMFFRFYLQ